VQVDLPAHGVRGAVPAPPFAPSPCIAFQLMADTIKVRLTTE
jgi:hypothetical protein